MESKILNAIASYEAEILDFTKELVNIDSGVDCPEGVRACAELVAEKLRPLGFEIELIERELDKIPKEKVRQIAKDNIEQIKSSNRRDFRF